MVLALGFAMPASAVFGADAPAAPTALTAVAVSSSRIDLSWVDNAVNEDFFKLQRQRDGGAWVGIFLPQDTTFYEDSGLTAGTYCYRVRSHNGSGFSSYALSTPPCVSVAGGGSPPDGPAAPSNLVAVKVSESRIDLSWADNSSDEKGFKMQRMVDGGAWRAIWHSRNTTGYTDAGLPAGSYCYRIRSYNDDGNSPYVLSVPQCISLTGGGGPPPPSGPLPPSELTALKVSEGRIDLAWVDNASDEKGFKMQYMVDGGAWTAIWHTRDTTAYEHTGLAAGTYCYRIRSYNDDGYSTYVLSAPTCIGVTGGGAPPGGPAAPSNLSIVSVSGGDVSLAWNDNSDDEKGFKMQRQLAGGTWHGIWHTRDTTRYTDPGLDPGTYCYRIRSYNDDGFSSYVTSTPACVVVGASGIGAQLVVSGLTQPLFLTAPVGDDRLFIIERPGRIRIFENGALVATPFLDITARVTTDREGGLLGLAFAPDYATSGLFYVNYTKPDPADGTVEATVIARYRVTADPDVADASSEEVLLEIPQPQGNHNGGTLTFGLDGYLYIGMGDGGGGGDPSDLAQNDATLLGKMLRLDVSGGLGSGYTIPPSNPHFGQALPLPEIWAKGFRNPYRFSVDRIFGDLYVGDVGQATREEVDVEPFGDAGGRNYGWRLMEGFLCFNPSSGCNNGSLTLPVYDYTQLDGRCSITGGYVYRGSIPDIFGHYFFADFCTGEVFSFVWDGGSGVTDFTDRTAQLAPATSGTRIVGFGEDGFGELYIVSITGAVFKIIPVP